MNEDQLADSLVKFGISRQEADLFILLTRLRRGGTEWVQAQHILRFTKIDRVRIYQLLQKLIRLGLVETTFSRPKRYSASSPQTAIRRLMAIQEIRLTELSHLEKGVVESLLQFAPVIVKEKSDSEVRPAGPDVIYLHGLPNVQRVLREMMEARGLSLIVNDESYDHLVGTINYLTRKPKSIRAIMAAPASRGKKRLRTAALDQLKVASFRYGLPTIVISEKQCVFLFYSVRRHKPRLLSPPFVTWSVSDSILVSSDHYVRQMQRMFDTIWDAMTSSQEIRSYGVAHHPGS